MDGRLFDQLRNLKDNFESPILIVEGNGLYSNDGIDYHNVKLDIPNFEKLSQFEKCCWYWRIVNERLRSFKFPLIRLEDLKGKPINAKPHSFPSWEEWTVEQKRQFNEILGDILPYYGYEKIKI